MKQIGHIEKHPGTYVGGVIGKTSAGCYDFKGHVHRHLKNEKVNKKGEGRTQKNVKSGAAATRAGPTSHSFSLQHVSHIKLSKRGNISVKRRERKQDCQTTQNPSQRDTFWLGKNYPRLILKPEGRGFREKEGPHDSDANKHSPSSSLDALYWDQ